MYPSVLRQEIGCVKRFKNDLFCFEWNVKTLAQLVFSSFISGDSNKNWQRMETQLHDVHCLDADCLFFVEI